MTEREAAIIAKSEAGLQAILKEVNNLQSQLVLPAPPTETAGEAIEPLGAIAPLAPPLELVPEEPETTKYVYGAAGLAVGLALALIGRLT
jgi:hypothetical protein